MLHYLEGYKSRSEAHHPITPRDHSRKQFYQAIDVLISSVRDRFNQPSFLVFENLESLLIKTLKGEETSAEIKIAREKYATDVNMSDLKVELAAFKVLMKDKQIEHFHDLLKELRLLENPEKKFLVNVCKICRIFAVNPASSATAERTFSLARMRSTPGCDQQCSQLVLTPSPFSVSTKIGQIN